MKKILFVCTGNICRSPTAEAIARHVSKNLGISDNFIFDSAGIEGYHVGEDPDFRTVAAGKKFGVSFLDIKARKIQKNDFEEFDLLMAMDRGHYSRLLAFAPNEHHHKIKLFLEFCDVKNSWNNEVIDPYYKDERAFEDVFKMIDLAIEKLFMKCR